MRQYYAQRIGLIDQTTNLSDDELTYYFRLTYRYFDSAKDGVWESRQNSKDIQILAPTSAPSPEEYF